MELTRMDDEKGMGLVEMLFWAGFIALIGWAAWHLYLHPEDLRSRPVSHNAYEDTRPSTP
jgi:hypothetical protein